jgi:UDP-N-acetylmuramate--alanine ligase
MVIFTLISSMRDVNISDIRMGIAGTHNVENAVAAIEAV